MKHPVDWSAGVGYVAGGGLAGVMAFLGAIYPAHAAQFNSAAIAIVAAAGLVRVLFNPTPPPGQTAVTTTTIPPTTSSLTTAQQEKP